MNNIDDYFKGLSAVIESAFPKTCAACGRLYPTAEAFLTETQNMPNGRSSLKEALEEDGTVIVEVFRNCHCGSTLMDEFSSRRDNSRLGKEKRIEFNNLLTILLSHQIPIEKSRNEIIKLFQGEKSELLDSLQNNN